MDNMMVTSRELQIKPDQQNLQQQDERTEVMNTALMHAEVEQQITVNQDSLQVNSQQHEQHSSIKQVGRLAKHQDSETSNSHSKWHGKSRQKEGQQSRKQRITQRNQVATKISEYDEANQVRENLVQGKAIQREMDFIKACQKQMQQVPLRDEIMKAGIEEADGKLTATLGMLDGVDKYSKKDVPLQDRSFLDASITFLQSIMGEAYRLIEEAAGTMNRFTDPTSVGITEALHREKLNFGESRVKIFDEAMSSFDKQEHVKWGEIMERCIGEKVIDLQNTVTGKDGSAASDLTTYQQDRQMKFFKADEKMQSVEQAKQAALNRIKDEDIRNRFAELMSNKALFNKVNSMMENLSYQFDGNKMKLAIIVRALPIQYQQLVDVNLLTKISPALKRMNGAAVVRYNMKTIGAEAGQELTPRNIATQRIAQLLGCGNLIVHSERTNIITNNGEEIKGFTMDGAKGGNIEGLKKQVGRMRKKGERESNNALSEKTTRDGYHQNFVKELVNLQILDNICGQKDRHMNNFVADYEKKGDMTVFTSVKGIDNDLCLGKTFDLTGKHGNSLGILDRRGNYNLPYIDREMVNSIRGMSGDIIRMNLNGILEKEYVDSAVDRFEKIRTGIERAIKEKPEMVISGKAWASQETIQELTNTRYINGTKTPDLDENGNPVGEGIKRNCLEATQTDSYLHYFRICRQY